MMIGCAAPASLEVAEDGGAAADPDGGAVDLETDLSALTGAPSDVVSVQLRVGSNQARVHYVSGARGWTETVTLDVPVTHRDGYNLVPARFVSEVFGAQVSSFSAACLSTPFAESALDNGGFCLPSGETPARTGRGRVAIPARENFATIRYGHRTLWLVNDFLNVLAPIEVPCSAQAAPGCLYCVECTRGTFGLDERHCGRSAVDTRRSVTARGSIGTSPRIVNGRFMVPIQALRWVLPIRADYEGSTRTITIRRAGEPLPLDRGSFGDPPNLDASCR